MRQAIAKGLIVIPILLFLCVYLLQEPLLNRGVLNKKDIGIVGNENATIYEYLTNVWFWDAAQIMLPVVTVICWIAAIVLYGGKCK